MTAFRSRSQVTGIQSAVICDRNVLNSSEYFDNGPNFVDSSESTLKISSQDQTAILTRLPSSEIDFVEKLRVLRSRVVLEEI